MSAMEEIPSIAGQPDNFIQWQLVFYRTGRRKNEIMEAVASPLSDDDIRNLGAFFASLPPSRPPQVKDAEAKDVGAKDTTASAEPGHTLGVQRHCDSCHGETFAGQQAAPRLAGQREAYLVKSLRDYQSNARPSSGGAAMTEVAGGLSDGDIQTLARYLAKLP